MEGVFSIQVATHGENGRTVMIDTEVTDRACVTDDISHMKTAEDIHTNRTVYFIDGSITIHMISGKYLYTGTFRPFSDRFPNIFPKGYRDEMTIVTKEMFDSLLTRQRIL